MLEQQLAALFPSHIEEIAARTTRALAASGYDALLVQAGEPPPFFLDDHAYPFRAHPPFRLWLPLLDAPGSYLHFEPGRRPRLVFHKPDDYWHLAAPLPAAWWTAHFDVVEVASREAARAALPRSLAGTAYLGEPFPQLLSWGLGALNPEHLVTRLDYPRAIKTRYEVECLREANRLGARAHQAARAAFLAGASEYEIHAAFLAACAQREHELPYNAIVALDRHGATLHYQSLDRTPSPQSGSLVIDAGVSFAGYGSDITRTWVREDAEFAALITAMDRLQLTLCAGVRAGRPWAEVHEEAVQRIAQLLVDARLVRCDACTAVESGIARRFFPHGIGHLLGLQVHDVGGFLAGPEGGTLPKPPLDQALRLTRRLETGFVVTMEPGIYFIDALLEPLRTGPDSRSIDWPRVDRLRRFGGIRIEDDLVVTANGIENLTREAFAAGR